MLFPRTLLKGEVTQWRIGIILVASSILAVFCIASPTEAKNISAEKANFVFYAPGLGTGEFETEVYRWGSVTIGQWVANPPFAVVFHEYVEGDYELRPGKPQIKKIMSKITSDRAAGFGSVSNHQGKFGNLRYVEFSQFDLDCVGFNKQYKSANSIYGFYCDYPQLSQDEIKSVLDSLGVKGYGKLPKKGSSPRHRSTGIELIDCELGDGVISTTRQACESNSGTVVGD